MSSLLLCGFKAAGKTTLGRRLARAGALPFVDLDHCLEVLYIRKKGARLSCRAIYQEEGDQAFRSLEHEALLELSQTFRGVVALGGGTLETKENIPLLHKMGCLVYLATPFATLLERIKEDPPAFLKQQLVAHLQELYARRTRQMEIFADWTLPWMQEDPLDTILTIWRKYDGKQ